MFIVGTIVLWIHLFSAILFIGGSFFIWVVVWPASYQITDDETLRTKVVGRIAKRFAYFTHITLGLLVATGIYLAYYYLGGFTAGNILHTTGGQLLFTKSLLVIIMITIVYTNNRYHGKLIMRLSREKKYDEMKRIRRRTHLFSYISLGIMVAISVLAAAMQFY